LLLLPDLKSSSGVTASQNGRGGILVSSRCNVSERLGFVEASDAETKNVTENNKIQA
jgi:hypothetical protein